MRVYSNPVYSVFSGVGDGVGVVSVIVVLGRVDAGGVGVELSFAEQEDNIAAQSAPVRIGRKTLLYDILIKSHPLTF